MLKTFLSPLSRRVNRVSDIIIQAIGEQSRERRRDREGEIISAKKLYNPKKIRSSGTHHRKGTCSCSIEFVTIHLLRFIVFCWCSLHANPSPHTGQGEGDTCSSGNRKPENIVRRNCRIFDLHCSFGTQDTDHHQIRTEFCL